MHTAVFRVRATRRNGQTRLERGYHSRGRFPSKSFVHVDDHRRVDEGHRRVHELRIALRIALETHAVLIAIALRKRLRGRGTRERCGECENLSTNDPPTHLHGWGDSGRIWGVRLAEPHVAVRPCQLRALGRLTVIGGRKKPMGVRTWVIGHKEYRPALWMCCGGRRDATIAAAPALHEHNKTQVYACAFVPKESTSEPSANGKHQHDI